MSRMLLALLLTGASLATVRGQEWNLADLPQLKPGRSAAANALWIENPLERRFHSSKRVVVADVNGPAVIQMVHFAMPQSHFGAPIVKLGRDVLLKAYWDGEDQPSIDCPLVDFFCDPAGTREVVATALVNKRRGMNAYFPMPFRKSARIELVYDGPVPPGESLWRIMPCYSYVLYRQMEHVPDSAGYFHAHWRQEALLLGQRDYLALDAKGMGKFVGWNVTVRRPGRDGYPVDMNERFVIDGAEPATIEFQGIEDSFGFSWGFPPSENLFPLTGFFPFLKGAMAYRFFVPDAICFEKSLRVTIGFGEHEHPSFRQQFSTPGNELQLSSVVYWYQREPHAMLPAMPAAAERKPAPEDPFWLHAEELPSAEAFKARGVRLHMRCGRPDGEVLFASKGFAATVRKGFAFAGWPLPVYHCRASEKQVEIALKVPSSAAGTVRIYVVDPDSFQGGRRQNVTVDDQALGLVEGFPKGRWLSCRVGPSQTADGEILVRATNARAESNAVLSIVEWVQARQ